MSLVSGFITERVGPRRMLLIDVCLALVTLLLLGFSWNLSLVFIGRLGMALALYHHTSIIYPLLAELCPPAIRGYMMASPGIAMSLGTLIPFILAYLLSWNLANITLAALLLPVICLMYFVPEVILHVGIS